MATCEQFQSQLLAYLYDLLEIDERQTLQAHLEQCPECQAALAHAKSQRQLLAVAAKAEFAGIKFQPPVEIAPAQASKPDMHLAGVRSSWSGWAIAASILVLLGLGTTGGWWTLTYQHEKQVVQANEEMYKQQVAVVDKRVQEHSETLRQAERKMQDLDSHLLTVRQEANTKWQDWQNRMRNQTLNVVLTGPAAVQPGGRNEYQIHTFASGQPAPAKVATRVLDGNKKVLFDQSVAMNGTYMFTLPADLPVKDDKKLFLEIAAERSDGQKQEIREELSLVAPVYLTHLTTDKPMYRPGETVHFRSLTLERYSLRPAQENFHLVYTVTDGNSAEVFHLEGAPQLHDDKNQALLGPDKKPVRGLGAGDYAILPGANGGEYTLTVREANNRFPQQQRKFIVNQYRNPLMNKELDFTRKSYGPGQEVMAACKVARVENRDVPIANQPVTATIQIDGKSYGADGKEGTQPFQGRTDATGGVTVRFKLPAVMERGLGTVAVLFTDGANHETLVKPIPIVLRKLDVNFFPESGDLIAGVSNRVYFQARSMLGKPAEVLGKIVDEDGKVVADSVQTLHDDQKPGVNQGMGLFSFTPSAGKTYELKIDVPSGIEGKYVLPKAQTGGVVLTIPTGVSAAKEAIHVTVQSPDKDRDLLVGAYCRGRLMDHQSVRVKKGDSAKLELQPARAAGGVYRVTVFEESAGQGNRKQLTPKAERLVYHVPAEQLILNAKPDKKQYVPGDKVTLELSGLNKKEQPAPAIAMVAVVDKSVITMADEKTYRTMPAQYYLTSEIQRPDDLEYADFLLSTDAKAPAALDLLLGTQGWRRFAEQDPNRFRQNNGPDAERLLATTGQATQSTVDLLQHEAQRLQQNYTTTLTDLTEQRSRSAAALVALRNDKTFPNELEALNQDTKRVWEPYREATNRLDAHVQLVQSARSLLLPVTAIALIVATLVLLIAAVRRAKPLQALPLYGSAALGLALLAGLFIYTPQKNSTMEHGLAFASVKLATNETSAPRSDPMTGVMFRDLAKNAEGLPPAPGQARAELLDGNKLLENDAWLGLKPAPNAAEGMERFGGAAKAPAMGLAAPMARFNKGMAAPLAAPAKPMDADAKNQERKKDRVPEMLKEAGRQVDKRMEAKRELKQAEGEVLGDLRRRQMGGEADQKALQGRAFANDRLEAPAGGPMRADGEEMRGGMGGGFGRMRAGFQRGMEKNGFMLQIPPPSAAPLMVREFAFQHLPASPGQGRWQLADTVYWHPALVLADGKGKVSFDLSDSVTGYQVTVFGHTLDGRIGAVTTLFEARKPLTLEPKLPIEVTSSDTIDVPVSIANNTPDGRPIRVHASAGGLELTGADNADMTVPPDGRTRRLFRFRPKMIEGEASVTIDGVSAPFDDRVTRTLTVVPDGFPIVSAHSEVLEGVAHQNVVLPDSWLKGTLKCQLQVFPSTLADLQKGLEGLLREPGGCFEQTSSSNYPNVLILNYLKESDQAMPELERRSRDLLTSGYQKLVAFECEDPSQPKRRGYEWFGGKAAPHEALTAYGLLEFRDMARVYDVDNKMIERTRQYLMSRKDGKGGFQRNAAAIDTFGRAPDNITNAYIVWALTESGKDDDIEKELTALSSQANDSKDPYFIALVANSLINQGKLAEGTALLKKIAAVQKADGHLDAAQTSITGSGGRDLEIETTALAVLGWLKANRPGDFTMALQKAVKWIGQQRGGYGGFGSTQSTILALKALIAFTKANKKTPEAGELKLYVADKLVAQKSFPAGVQDALVLDIPQAERVLKSGKNSVRVEITGKNVFPYTLTSSYRTLKPASAEKLPVRLSTQLDRAAASEGETVHLTIHVENTEDRGQGMAVAVVGLPAGLTLPEDMKQLKDFALLRNNGKEKGLIGAWELRGRELVLYWRDLAPKQQIEVPLDLICRVPGEYRGPASRAYLYYNADHKHWIDPLSVSITAKE